MSNNSRFPVFSIPMGGHRIYDPYSYEMAQAFLKSECVSNALDSTFAGTKVEFEDLDGLPWLVGGAPTPRFKSGASLFGSGSMQVEPDSPLGPVFGPEDDHIPALSFAFDWFDVSQTPAYDIWGHDFSMPYERPRRKLSRSPRTLESNFSSPQNDAPNPFSFVPVSSEEEVESNESLGASISRPSSTKGKRDRLGAFLVQELPQVGDDSSEEDSSDGEWGPQVYAIGPPPGLPSPGPSFQPLDSSV